MSRSLRTFGSCDAASSSGAVRGDGSSSDQAYCCMVVGNVDPTLGLLTHLLDILQTGVLWSRWSICPPFLRSYAAQRPQVRVAV